MMKLHEALKKVFWQFGIAVLQEKRLIFILADFKQQEPETRQR